jgi:tRNA(Ile)-lysidine synthase
MVEDATIMIYQQVARQEEENIKFDIKQLKLPNYKSYLYQWLNEFVRLGDIYDLVESQLENKFFSGISLT